MFSWFGTGSQDSDQTNGAGGTGNVSRGLGHAPRSAEGGINDGTDNYSTGRYPVQTYKQNSESSGGWGGDAVNGSGSSTMVDGWRSAQSRQRTATTLHDSMQHRGNRGPMATQYGRTPAQYSNAQYSNAQYSSAQYSSAQFSNSQNHGSINSGFHSSIRQSDSSGSSKLNSVYGARVRSGGQQQSTKQIEGECRSTMKATIQSAAETNVVAQATSERLEAQGEQINRIHDDAEAIDSSLDTSEYILNGMRSWWHSATQLLVPPPNPNGSKVSRNSNNTGSQKADGQDSASNQPSVLNLFGMFGTGNGTDSVADASAASEPQGGLQQHAQRRLPATSEFDQELNQDLDTLSTMLEEMHSRAVTMGETIEHQNVKLESVETLVNRNNERVMTQKRQMDKLMGK